MRYIRILTILAMICVAGGVISGATVKRASVRVTHTAYHGWSDAIVVSNGIVEVVIVPAVGRVMQFRFVGENGPFWENRELDGRSPDPDSKEWLNFGGDKSWPAPQADWPKVTPRGWPPPQAFDAQPVTARVRGGTVELISPVDPHYGIRVRRLIRLDPVRPVLDVSTRYEKVTGSQVKVAAWVITQLNDPQRVFVPIPTRSIFQKGYQSQSTDLPQNLKLEDRLISLTRSSQVNTKVGTDAGTLVWIGEQCALRIDSARRPSGEYPDQGCSAEVYTNRDPQTYVELEMLGPLKNLTTGSNLTQSSRYTLFHRTAAEPAVQAESILGHRLRY